MAGLVLGPAGPAGRAGRSPGSGGSAAGLRRPAADAAWLARRAGGVRPHPGARRGGRRARALGPAPPAGPGGAARSGCGLCLGFRSPAGMNHDAPAPPDESPLVGWLSGAGLLHLAPLLRAHAIDVDVLGSLSEADLVHIGLPLGDRKRLLQAWAQGPWQPPADAEGQRRQLTIVFADLADSTAWCQALSPEAWRELVLGFQRAAVDVLQRHGGVVAQYLGDGVLAYFCYPQAREDAATRAVHAGLALADAMERLPVPQAFAGRTQLGGQVVCEDLGVPPLKGVREPRRVWRVKGLSGSGLRFEDAGVGPRSPLVGRQHELAWLQSLWQGALKGQGQAVLLSGEAGIVKSRMVRELRARLGLAGVQAPMLQCSPWHVHAPLHPLREGLRRRLGFRAEP